MSGFHLGGGGGHLPWSFLFLLCVVCVCYRYLVNSTVSKRVGNLNPAWNENVSNEEIDVR